jgi:hypothetical protein
VRLTNHLRAVLRLRMKGAIPHSPCMPSQHVQVQHLFEKTTYLPILITQIIDTHNKKMLLVLDRRQILVWNIWHEVRNRYFTWNDKIYKQKVQSMSKPIQINQNTDTRWYPTTQSTVRCHFKHMKIWWTNQIYNRHCIKLSMLQHEDVTKILVKNSTAFRDALLVLLLKTVTLKCLGNHTKTCPIHDTKIISKLWL